MNSFEVQDLRVEAYMPLPTESFNPNAREFAPSVASSGGVPEDTKENESTSLAVSNIFTASPL